MSAPAILARLKQACRSAVALSGGIDGAAATTGKARATCGNWNNRNMADMPTLADAFVLDEVAVIAGKRPPIVSALASELGGVFLPLPDIADEDDGLTASLVEATSEFGDIAASLIAAKADGDLTEAECADLVREIDEAQAALSRMRHRACGHAVRAVPVNDRRFGETQDEREAG